MAMGRRRKHVIRQECENDQVGKHGGKQCESTLAQVAFGNRARNDGTQMVQFGNSWAVFGIHGPCMKRGAPDIRTSCGIMDGHGAW